MDQRSAVRARLGVCALASLVAALPALAADGAPDLTFWGDGRYSASAGAEELFLHGVVEAPDDALVWYGFRWTPGPPYPRTPRWRRLTDAVESGCELALPAGVRGSFRTAAFDASGRLVLAGEAELVADQTDRLLFARYVYPSCVLDTAFDGDGVLLLDLAEPTIALVNDVATQGDAIVFASVVQAIPDSPGDGVVGRLLPSGTPDGSFSTDGLYWFDGRAGVDNLVALELAPGGRIYAAGFGYLPDLSDPDFYLLALQNDGTPVPGYGLDGLVTVDFGASSSDPSDYLRDLALLDDGRVLLAGTTAVETPLGYGGALAVITATGSPDPTFGVDGKLTEPLRYDFSKVVAQGNGRFLVGAYDSPSPSFFVARRLADGSPDPAFGGGAWVPVTYPEGGSHETFALALQGGRVVVGGHLQENNAPDLAAVARLKNAYVFADGFETGAVWFWSLRTP